MGRSKEIPLFKVFMSEDVLQPVNDVLMSGYIGQGPKVTAFEDLLATRLGNPYVTTVNSATSGLHLALHLLKNQPKQSQVKPLSTAEGAHDLSLAERAHLSEANEVLTTPVTCVATNWPILAHGLRLKWVDVDPATGNMDVNDLARKLSPTTKAIMVVHWGGYPCDLKALKQVQAQCRARYNFTPAIIEDCAHAWGSTYDGQPLGNHGNMCVFSFQAIKTLTTGDGGLLVVAHAADDKRAKLLRWYGLDRASPQDFRTDQDIEEWGYKYHMNDINATIGLHNFPYIDSLIKVQQANAAYYNQVLATIPGVTLLEFCRPHDTSSYWIYTLRVPRRQDFQRKMRECGIMVSRVHRRNDHHASVQEFQVPLPGVDAFCSDMICIPCGWWVTPEDRAYIADCIKSGW